MVFVVIFSVKRFQNRTSSTSYLPWSIRTRIGLLRRVLKQKMEKTFSLDTRKYSFRSVVLTKGHLDDFRSTGTSLAKRRPALRTVTDRRPASRRFCSVWPGGYQGRRVGLRSGTRVFGLPLGSFLWVPHRPRRGPSIHSGTLRDNGVLTRDLQPTLRVRFSSGVGRIRSYRVSPVGRKRKEVPFG